MIWWLALDRIGKHFARLGYRVRITGPINPDHPDYQTGERTWHPSARKKAER